MMIEVVDVTYLKVFNLNLPKNNKKINQHTVCDHIGIWSISPITALNKGFILNK